MVTSFYYSCMLSHIFAKERIDCSVDNPQRLGKKINDVSLRKGGFERVNNEWIPRAPRAPPAPPAPRVARHPVAPAPEGDISLASLSEMITQMEGRIMRCFDYVYERLDMIEYSVARLQDDDEDDDDGDGEDDEQ